MTTALYRQSRNSLYNDINFYKNSAINQSVQTIFQLYHLTSKSNQKDKNIKRKPFPKELSSNLSALPKIERPKEEKKNTEQSINYIKKNPILKYISPNNRSIILPKLKISNVSLNKNSIVNQSCKTIGGIYLSPIVKKSFEIFGQPRQHSPETVVAQDFIRCQVFIGFLKMEIIGALSHGNMIFAAVLPCPRVARCVRQT